MFIEICSTLLDFCVFLRTSDLEKKKRKIISGFYVSSFPFSLSFPFKQSIFYCRNHFKVRDYRYQSHCRYGLLDRRSPGLTGDLSGRLLYASSMSPLCLRHWSLNISPAPCFYTIWLKRNRRKMITVLGTVLFP